MGKTKALIITDESSDIQSIAHSIKDALQDINVKTVTAEKFEGTDLLPVDMFILGCENPNPVSFAYLEDMLSHINLASRKCCIFSTSEKTIMYLKGIVKDCEADLLEPHLTVKEKLNKSEIKNWHKGL